MLPFKGIYWHNIYSKISIYFSKSLSYFFCNGTLPGIYDFAEKLVHHQKPEPFILKSPYSDFDLLQPFKAGCIKTISISTIG
jgi:hypothetical protein